MPPEPGEPYAGEEQPERSTWEELSRSEILDMQLEEGRLRVRESGVMACRENQREPVHGDKWCRACFQARPAGHECLAGNFRPPVRYAKVDGVVVSLAGSKLLQYLREQRKKGMSREQAFA